MNSFSFIRSGALLEMLSDILDTVEQLHTVSIEFTVKRENGSVIGLEINLQCYLAEQKALNNWTKRAKQHKKPKKHVEQVIENLKKREVTVSTNC